MSSKNSDQQTSQSDWIRVSPSINDGEEAKVQERKSHILEWLRQQNFCCDLDHVPHIAILGSGGGLRAMLGLLGTLVQLGEEGLLNCALYLCGVSGSTWCMSSLYQDPGWSHNLPAAEEKISHRLAEGTCSWDAMVERLEKAFEDENCSLTDIWAATAVYYMVKEMDTRKLSEERGRETENPYPIYAVIDEKLKQDASWFEITPHEAGYSGLDGYVETSHMGSKFESGNLLTKKEEMDILYLQALCGSALADWTKDWKVLTTSILNFLVLIWGESGNKKNINTQECECKGCAVVQILLELWDSSDSERDCETHFLSLREIMKDKGERQDHLFVKSTQEDWRETGREGRETYIRLLAMVIFGCLSGWYICKAARILGKILPYLRNWIWGTKFNFLYKLPVADSKLVKEKISLIDAGLLLNSAYPLVLHPKRKVDLILSFDFSADDPFLTVEQAQDYCKEKNLKFPKVEVPAEDRGNPSDCYVFEGQVDTPTVIHIPLFNKVNCGDDIKKWQDRYSTFKPSYSKKDIEDLLNVAKSNVQKSREEIFKQIQKAITRKQQQHGKPQ